MPVPTYETPWQSPVRFTVQAHFGRGRRSLSWLHNALEHADTSNLLFQFVGTTALETTNRILHVKPYIIAESYLSESSFYSFLNTQTHFLFPLIDATLHTGSYIRESYSSNFNLAWALEKPLFCNECFKDIYGVPGVYYNSDNFAEKLAAVKNLEARGYQQLVATLKEQKAHHRAESASKIKHKIAALLN